MTTVAATIFYIFFVVVGLILHTKYIVCDQEAAVVRRIRRVTVIFLGMAGSTTSYPKLFIASSYS